MIILPTTAYCMNLDIRKDRWEQVTIDFERLRSEMEITMKRISSVENSKKPSAGVAATFKKIIKRAKKKRLPYVLIIEDDLFVIDPRKVVDALNNVPEDWDILLGGVYHYVPDSKYNEHWTKVQDFCSLHFIIVCDRIYDKVLALNTNTQHLDRVLGADKSLNVYLIHPMPCQQRSGYSNIRKKQVNDNRRRTLPWVDHHDTLL